MSELTEREIDLARDAMQLGYRQYGHEGDCEWVNQLCDMAKRTLDEETNRKIAVRRAEKAETALKDCIAAGRALVYESREDVGSPEALDRMDDAMDAGERVIQSHSSIGWQAQRSAVLKPDGSTVTTDDSIITDDHHWEYYYRENRCTAPRTDDPGCICWHREGTGPFPHARHDDPDESIPKEWRYINDALKLTPEQAGDALAATQGKAREHFETLLGDLGFEDAVKYGCSGGPDQDSMRESVEIIRQSLTASGVPGEVRRIVERMKEQPVGNWVRELEAALTAAPHTRDQCTDGLLPDGQSCPRCGGERAPSGVGGGTWVHVTE